MDLIYFKAAFILFLSLFKLYIFYYLYKKIEKIYLTIDYPLIGKGVYPILGLVKKYLNPVKKVKLN